MHSIATLLVALGFLWQATPTDSFLPTSLSSRYRGSTLLPTSIRATTLDSEEELLQDADGIQIGPYQQLWNAKIAELINYNATFGTVNVPRTHYFNGDEWASLAHWVSDIRKRQGILSEERREQLTAMGFLWKGCKEEKENQQWEAMFQRLVGHKEVHGDCLVPQKWDIDKSLGFWVQHQRRWKKTGTMREDRAAKLDSIGFVWVVRKLAKPKSRKRDRQWCRMYIKLIRHYREHGDY